MVFTGPYQGKVPSWHRVSPVHRTSSSTYWSLVLTVVVNVRLVSSRAQHLNKNLLSEVLTGPSFPSSPPHNGPLTLEDPVLVVFCEVSDKGQGCCRTDSGLGQGSLETRE